jgi:outer membrane protein TolC
LEQALFDQQTAINVLMNRPAGSPLGKPDALTFRAMPWTPAVLEETLLAKRPEISVAAQRLAAEEARLQLARREWIPDPQVRVEARHFRASNDTFTEYDTGLFFSVPWANPAKYRAGISEAQKTVEAMRREVESQRVVALGKLRDQLRRIDTLRKQYEISRDKLVPLARRTAETLRINYQSDTANFLELLSAQRMLREAEAAMSTQLADYLAALAELESIVGFDPGSPVLSQGSNANQESGGNR